MFVAIAARGAVVLRVTATREYPSRPLCGWPSGGLFGSYGRFWSRRLGALRVERRLARVRVTPDDPDAFVAAVRAGATR